jgi:hypothetical protein
MAILEQNRCSQEIFRNLEMKDVGKEDLYEYISQESSQYSGDFQTQSVFWCESGRGSTRIHAGSCLMLDTRIVEWAWPQEQPYTVPNHKDLAPGLGIWSMLLRTLMVYFHSLQTLSPNAADTWMNVFVVNGTRPNAIDPRFVPRTSRLFPQGYLSFLTRLELVCANIIS